MMVAGKNPLEDSVAPFLHSFSQENGAEHRNDSERYRERTNQGENGRVRHRLEQPSRRTGKHVNREEARDDDGGRVDDRPIDLRCSSSDDPLYVVTRPVPAGELAMDVLGHDQRAVYEYSKI